MVSAAFQSYRAQVPDSATISWPRFPAAHALDTQRPATQVRPGFIFPRPKGHQVHIWAASLDAPPSARAAYQETLSNTELDRASRFHFEEHRNRYIVAHGWLRQLLAGYLCVPAASIEFEHSSKGKPALAGQANSSELQFNLTHSGGLSLIAIAHKTPVGIDVERIRRLEDAEELAGRFFSKREASSFKRVSDAEKSLAFFNLWTRKEAWLKATGEGIAHLLNKVEVSFLPGEPARFLNLPRDFSDSSNWSLGDLSPASGFAAAFALAASTAEPDCRSWDHEFIGLSL